MLDECSVMMLFSEDAFPHFLWLHEDLVPNLEPFKPHSLFFFVFFVGTANLPDALFIRSV